MTSNFRYGAEPVKLSQIIKDVNFQVRNAINQATVKRYADMMKAGKKLAPIKLASVDGSLMLVDGWHRVAAHESLGLETAQAEIVVCSFKEAQWLAASANLEHGLPLKISEMRNVFRAYIETGRHITGKKMQSYREIGTILGKPHTTIRNWMLEDFPDVAEKMGGGEATETGGLRDIDVPDRSEADEYLSALADLFQSSSDPDFRGTIIGAVRETLADMETSGRWNEPEKPEF